jgi:nucleotide-binding universal stress UspA family protein
MASLPAVTVTDVLVPLDRSAESETAVPFAAVLATRLDAQVRLLTVSKHPDPDAQAFLDRVVRTHVHVPVTTDVVVGDEPALEIAAAAGLTTLVCMRSHARGRLTHTMFGSVAEQVLRTTARPVVLVGPHADVAWPLERVVLPLDGSELAESVIPYAAAWAGKFDLPIFLVNVLDPYVKVAMTEAGLGSDLDEAAYLRSIGRALQQLGFRASWDVLHDKHAGEAIAAYADAEQGSLIAMSTHGRTGLAAVTAGSVTTRVVHLAKSPVLAIRPAHP